MDRLLQWLRQLEFSNLIEMLLIAAASLFCITVHEVSHGLVAYWLGDDTAKRQGRLSLNPLRHIDIVGLVMMVVVRFGWAKPVPVNMLRFKHPKVGMALTSAAGPLSNVLLMLVAAILRAVLLAADPLVEHAIVWYALLFLEYMMILSAGLAVFNVFPIPPLDGSKVLFSLLPNKAYLWLMRYERYGMLLLIVVLFTDLLDVPLLYMRGALLQLSYIISQPIFNLFIQLF